MILYCYKTCAFFLSSEKDLSGENTFILNSNINKKQNTIDYTSTTGELKAILKICIPTTLSHLVGNFTYFLEPIVYVWILTILNFQQSQIEESYTIVNAFTISLLTLGSFVSTALATTVVPSISESNATNDISKVNYFIKKSPCLAGTFLFLTSLCYNKIKYFFT